MHPQPEITTVQKGSVEEQEKRRGWTTIQPRVSFWENTKRVLDGLSLRCIFLLLAPGAYREDERRDPDRDEHDIGHGGKATRESYSVEERVCVYD